MPKHKFTTKLYDASNGFVCLDLPANLITKLDLKRRTPVDVSVNGFNVRTSVFPNGNGGFIMLVNKQIQAGSKATVGDTVSVQLEVDTAPRTVQIPPDFQKALAKSKKAKEVFTKSSYTKQKDHITYIEAAKRPETRARRIEQTIETLISTD